MNATDPATDSGPAPAWADAMLAAYLLAVHPDGLRGMVVRSWAGPTRDLLCERLRALMGHERPWVRAPATADADALLGGLSVDETLRAGAVRMHSGLLSRAHRGTLVAAMAERMEPVATALVCHALDQGSVALQRDGFSDTTPARFALLALDEGTDDEGVHPMLAERLAFGVDLHAVPPHATEDDGFDDVAARERCVIAARLLPSVMCPPEVVQALVEAAAVLGARSLRAPLLAVAAARAHAALHARTVVTDEDAQVAARLVLGHRATVVQEASSGSEDDPQDAPPREPPPPSQDTSSKDDDRPPPDDTRTPDPRALQDVLVEAARAAVPLDLLRLPGRQPRVRGVATSGKAGALRQATSGGRPRGSMPGTPEGGRRLHVLETLRAAAPWQTLRRASPAAAHITTPLILTRSDLRVRVYARPSQTCVVFCVDASGSAAAQRLAEAKGAVEQVLLDCYARRDLVALVTFRGEGATVMLPPTRALTRANRTLRDMRGGGGTPLAAGLDSALAVALDARRRGQTPLLVVMTDARANVSLRQGGTRAQAAEDALEAAGRVARQSVPALLLDTAPRPGPAARALAGRMAARYLPLPYADATVVAGHVRSTMQARGA